MQLFFSLRENPLFLEALVDPQAMHTQTLAFYISAKNQLEMIAFFKKSLTISLLANEFIDAIVTAFHLITCSLPNGFTHRCV